MVTRNVIVDFAAFQRARAARSERVAQGERFAAEAAEDAAVIVSRPFAIARRPPVLSLRQLAHREQMLRHLSARER